MDLGDHREAVTRGINMTDFTFEPNEIRVTANADDTIILNNVGAIPHSFVIDELGIDTGPIDPGESTTITVDAEVGQYTFYCNVGDHLEEVMEGTLSVV